MGWQALLGQKEEILRKTQGQDMETSQLKETVRRQKEQLKQIFNEMSQDQPPQPSLQVMHQKFQSELDLKTAEIFQLKTQLEQSINARTVAKDSQSGSTTLLAELGALKSQLFACQASLREAERETQNWAAQVKTLEADLRRRTDLHDQTVKQYQDLVSDAGKLRQELAKCVPASDLQKSEELVRNYCQQVSASQRLNVDLQTENMQLHFKQNNMEV